MGYIEEKMVQAQGLLGKRIEIPVHFDMWMRGARFGKVTSVGTGGEWICVKMEHPEIKRRVKVARIDYDYVKVCQG